MRETELKQYLLCTTSQTDGITLLYLIEPTLVYCRVHVWFDGETVLGEAGFKIHLRDTNYRETKTHDLVKQRAVLIIKEG